MIRLALGREIIEALLPHRAPLLLVETIEGFAPGKAPRLRATLALTGSEPVFAGHFPGEPIWPGAYLLEGLAQCGGLLLAMQAMYAAGGEAALTQLGHEPSGLLTDGPRSGALVRGQVDCVHPVRPPANLRYEVRLAGALGTVFKIDGHVDADGRAVAEGSLSLALFSELPS